MAAAPSERCLVYSFGIAGQWEFDDSMAARGCDVHSFDPTGATMAEHKRHTHPSGRVNFHPWGLSGEAKGCDDARRFSGGTYGALTGPLLTLDQIVRRLRHTGRRIAVLKIDCEGCEWAALHHLAMNAPATLGAVDSILLELHLANQMESATDLIKLATTHQSLFRQHGFKMWWVHANPARDPSGPGVHEELRRAAKALGHSKPVPGAWEIGLRRVPNSQQPSQQPLIFSSVANTGAQTGERESAAGESRAVCA